MRVIAEWIFVFFAVFVLIVEAPQSVAEDHDEKHSLYSKALKETRPYLVHLPENYNKAAEYPVVYLLDGSFLHSPFAGIIDYLSSYGQIPPTILVSVPNTTSDDGTNRFRDLTPTHSLTDIFGKEEPRFEKSGGAANFLKFITEELIPEVEQKYSTSGSRILTGHSMSGLFTLHALLEAPVFFNSYIAIDPTVYWDNELLSHRLHQKHTLEINTTSSVYVSSCDNMAISFLDHQVMMSTQNNFINALKDRKPKNLTIRFEHFANEDHMTVPLVSFAHGLTKALKITNHRSDNDQ